MHLATAPAAQHPDGLAPPEEEVSDNNVDLVVIAVKHGFDQMNETLRSLRNDLRMFGAAFVVVLIIAFAVALGRNVTVRAPGVEVSTTQPYSQP